MTSRARKPPLTLEPALPITFFRGWTTSAVAGSQITSPKGLHSAPLATLRTVSFDLASNLSLIMCGGRNAETDEFKMHAPTTQPITDFIRAPYATGDRQWKPVEKIACFGSLFNKKNLDCIAY